MVNASNLPSLFSESTWQTGGGFVHDGEPKLLASIDGWWVETTDIDGIHIEQADFDTIAGASVHPDNDGSLLIGGEKKVVSGRVVNGVRWVRIIDFEPE